MKVFVLPSLLAVALSVAAAHAGDDKAKVTVRANPSMGMSPVRVVVTADVKGGANEDVYCSGVEWEWGDDTRSTDIADCDPYVDGKSDIKRHFTADHTYRTAGEYQVQFRLKKKTKVVGAGNTMVRVRPGLGDGGGGDR